MLKQIRPEGCNQEDLVELLYYINAGQTSILNYLSTLGDVVSAYIKSLSTITVFSGDSWSGTVLSISKLAGHPTSMTDLTGVSITITAL